MSFFLRNQMVSLSKQLSLASFVSWILFPLINAQLSCPDGSQCADGKQCCSVYPHKFTCCEVWRLLLQEIEVAGREHSLGVPSEFGWNQHYSRCNKSTCRGTCCSNFCCQHRNAECCGSPHQCCEVGYKCCGSGKWCCPWITTCSEAFGYCISSAFSLNRIPISWSFIALAFLNIRVFCHLIRIL